MVLGMQVKGIDGGVVAFEAKDGLFPSKVLIEMMNFIEKEHLIVHCKDKHHDLGAHTINTGETYSFVVTPNVFAKVTLYFCKFYLGSSSHYFDIYRQDRDNCPGHDCYWGIFEDGLCRLNLKSRQCYGWNEN
ncbi:S-protein homolog 2-like [Phaseolus vulgaris]